MQPSICRLSFLNFLVQILKNIKDKPASFDNLLVFKIILVKFTLLRIIISQKIVKA